MKKKTIEITVVILLIVVSLCGCLENNKELTTDQIKTNFINAINNVSSYKCNITGVLNSTIFIGAETSGAQRSSNTNLSVDISNHTLVQETEFLTVGKDEKDMMIVYLVDNFKYTGLGKEGNISWESETLSSSVAGSIWNIFSALEQFAEQMTDEVTQQDYNITWKRLKDESYDNQRYYVLQSKYIANNSNATHTGYSYGETYHTFWIDKTNYFLYKVKLNQIRDDTGWFAGEYDRRYLESEDIFTFYDYNIPVNIELPPDVIP